VELGRFRVRRHFICWKQETNFNVRTLTPGVCASILCRRGHCIHIGLPRNCRGFKEIRDKTESTLWIWGSHRGGYEEFYFPDITPCSPLKDNWCLGGTCHLHHQGRRISQRRKHSSVYHLLHAPFLPVLFLDPEGGADMFLRNVCWLNGLHSLYPRRWNYSEFTLCDVFIFIISHWFYVIYIKY
jgi:hypothetical protein